MHAMAHTCTCTSHMHMHMHMHMHICPPDAHDGECTWHLQALVHKMAALNTGRGTQKKQTADCIS